MHSERCNYCGMEIVDDPIVIQYKEHMVQICNTDCFDQFAYDIHAGTIEWDYEVEEID